MARHSPFERWRQRRIDYPLQYLLVAGLFALLRALPLDAASAVGGWVGRTVGPRLPMTRRARAHLARALPDLDEAARRRTIVAMWDNIGRVFAEYPHLGRMWDEGRVTIEGREHVAALVDDDRPGIIIGAHLANWEVPTMIGRPLGIALTMVYRHANNPGVDRLLGRARSDAGARFVRKGPEAARGVFATLRGGGHVAMLVDQKLNRGLALPFFGRTAMTTPAPSVFARSFDCPVVPMQTIREEGARFRIVFHPPMQVPRTGDAAVDDAAFMTTANAMIEGWIRERPAQWLWLHRRWKD